MILNRIVELQAKTVIRKITSDQAEYDFLEKLVESSKPELPESAHHYLIRSSFRYPLPVAPEFQARFRPPYFNKNTFYGCATYVTTVFEYGYHWLRQRVHVMGLSQEPQSRTHFQVSFKDRRCLDIRKIPGITKIMNRKDYSASHHFVRNHPELTSLLYPSCRDPDHGDSVVTFLVTTLGKEILSERTVNFIYHEKEKKCVVEYASEDVRQKNTNAIEVSWAQVV